MKCFTWLCVLCVGCAQSVPVTSLPSLEADVVQVSVQEWQAMDLGWSERCEWRLQRLIVDRRIERCLYPAWECVEAERVIHIAPDIEELRGEGAYARTLAHAVGHILLQCSGSSWGRDPDHRAPGIWENAGDSGWLRRAQRSMGSLGD